MKYYNFSWTNLLSFENIMLIFKCKVIISDVLFQKETCHPELEYCPTFKPLLSTSLNIPETRPLLTELVKQIDSQSCLDLCIYFQNHLQQCSEAVKFDQAALIARIKVSSCLLQLTLFLGFVKYQYF